MQQDVGLQHGGDTRTQKDTDGTHSLLIPVHLEKARNGPLWVIPVHGIGAEQEHCAGPGVWLLVVWERWERVF